jgi:hypothetical protein
MCLLENSNYAVSDIAARDLISSYFRFPWELTLSDFCAFARDLSPPPAAPPGEVPRGILRNRWRGSCPSFS